MYFNEDGTIKPVEITFRGVRGRGAKSLRDAIEIVIAP
jgi:hypothetical protein